ncbi:MAG TPA: DUF4339 domain-containing protein [Candidatus Acidoferrales bacterium]|nr:DUF4339 domain-containing protein [Candidatus Acidoferrales bacterium]
MYKIIGGDGQEYGPVTDADLRQWIAEGRLNAHSLAKGEGDAEFHPLSTFPEFAGALGTAATTFGESAPILRAVDWSARDYDLDIGRCISRGWSLFADNLGILLGSTILYFVLVFVVAIVLGFIANAIALPILGKEAMQSAGFKVTFDFLFRIVTAPLFGALAGGIYYIVIQTMRGRPHGVGELFIGFQKMFLHLFLGYLVFSLVTAVCFAPFTIIETTRIGPALAQFQRGGVPPSEMQSVLLQMWAAFSSCLPIFVLCVIPAVYLTVNLSFVLPLIIDKEMDFWTAIKTSWRMVHKHWFTLFGLLFLIGLINIVGVCLCCIGVFFTFAFTTAASMFAYETIFGESRST